MKRRLKRQPTTVRAPAIIKEAVRLFTLNGYDATSVDAIAAEVGITKASVYHHFSGKEEILSAAMGSILDPLEHLLAETKLKKIPALDQLQALIVSVIQLTGSHRGEVLLLSTIKSSTKAERSAQLRRRRFQASVDEIIASAIEEGSISSFYDPRVLGRLIFGMTNSVMYWWNPDSPSNPLGTQELLNQILGLINAGVGHRSPAGLAGKQIGKRRLKAEKTDRLTPAATDTSTSDNGSKSVALRSNPAPLRKAS